MMRVARLKSQKGAKSTSTKGFAKPKSTQTTRSTAGPGFDFEDQVAAWFLAKALLDQPIVEKYSNVTRLQSQTAALGWLIDDLLLTNAGGHHIAISCKSNLQVSGNGLPNPKFLRLN